MDSTTIINQTQDEPKAHGFSSVTSTVKTPRSAAVNTLAIVGFLALIFIGIGLAIYSSQFVPSAVSKLTVANNPANDTGFVNTTGSAPIGVVSANVPATTTTMVASGATAPSEGTVNVPPATAYADNSDTTTVTPSYTTTPAPTNYEATAGVAHATLYGLPNLTTNVIAVGYLANGAPDNFSSFVASPVIPVGSRAAVQFVISNTGTNATGPWNFIAQIPTDNGYIYTSPTEENMNPGDHITFTLGFDQVPPGNNEPVTIIADPNNYLQETTKSDNTTTAVITVAQS